MTIDLGELDDDAALTVALSGNNIRRHDSASVRALDAARLTDLANENGKPPAPGKLSIPRAAQLCGVSHANVQRARTLLMYGSDALIDAVRSGVVALPRSADDINDLEARIATLSRDKVRDPEPSSAPEQPDRAEVMKLIRQRDAEIKRRKKAEAALRATDREMELARQLADAQAEQARLAALVESHREQAGGGTGAEALMKPTVIRQRDPAAERRAEWAEKELAEAQAALEKERAANERYQTELIAAAKKNAYFEGRLRETADNDIILSTFAKEVLEWRRHCGVVATLMKARGRYIDPQTEEVCIEVAKRLTRIAEMLKDSRAPMAEARRVIHG